MQAHLVAWATLALLLAPPVAPKPVAPKAGGGGGGQDQPKGPPEKQAPEEEEGKPMPYHFEWEVKNKDVKPSGIFARHEETVAEAAPTRTEGEYRVWLPDGRLMVVAYYVDGESGFVPTITYEDNHVPKWKK